MIKTYKEIYSDPSKGIIRSEEDAHIVGIHNGVECELVCDRNWGEYTSSVPDITITRVIGFNNTEGSYIIGSFDSNAYATMYDANGVAIPYDDSLIECGMTNHSYQENRDINGWTALSSWPISSTTSGYLRVQNKFAFDMSCSAVLFYKSSEPTISRTVYSAQGNYTSAAAYTDNDGTWYYVLCLDETTWVKGEEGLNTIDFYLTNPSA